MLYQLKTLQAYQIQASDGQIGTVHDLYFEDSAWELRYLVVDTGGWLSGRKVLLDPLSLKEPNQAEQTLPVTLTQEQVRSSPDIDIERPISRQSEADLRDHYRWPPVDRLGGGLLESKRLGMRPDSIVETIQAKESDREASVSEAVMRSAREISGYGLQTSEGSGGQVKDVVLATDSWIVRYLVVDTGQLLPGKKTLLSSAWVEQVSWNKKEVRVDVAREMIEQSPTYEPDQKLDRAYEAKIHEHYKRPEYWS
jgi:sporulation protein YlmC with PRC-barrel domain